MKKISSWSIVWLAILLITMSQPSALAGTKSKTLKVRQVTRTTSGRVDLCLGCHKERPDKAHGREVLGCAVCHMGNPLAGDKRRAHRGMVLNPGELRFVGKTCGQSGCHPKEVTWVKNSLMATNRGIISTLRFYWGETSNHNEDLTVKMLKDTGMDSPALDYYRKMCGSCHLWVERRTLPDFLVDRGGGCTACHLVKKPEAHPWIVKGIPIENCVRCHNRSGRIGLSYQGQMESEGYGTPYEKGDFSDREYVDGRFYRILNDDIHHRKGMICIDCHTQKEVMGDGKCRAHFERQLEVTCQTCHGDSKILKAISKAQKANLTASNSIAYQQVGKTTGPPKLDILEKGRSFFLKGKQDKKLHPLDPPDPVACLHPVHRRLSCQACHSRWVPQCYGCHILQDKTKTQLDKLAIKETPGRWEEFRSFVCHTCPPLGVFVHNKYQRVVILVPGCQDFVSFLDEGGKWTGNFRRLTVSWMDPHTTQKAGRSCKECHQDPRALGLGQGSLSHGRDEWKFTPALSNSPSSLNIKHPLDAFVDIKGRPLVHTSRKGLRPFNSEEINKILYVGLCLPCHKDFRDPVMKNWVPGHAPSPCPLYNKSTSQ